MHQLMVFRILELEGLGFLNRRVIALSARHLQPNPSRGS